MLTAEQFLDAINSRLFYVLSEKSPLIEQVRYTLEARGAKRVRPVMTMLAAQLFTSDISSRHLAAAIAIEVFHNFTLVHDDIMDNAALRRGMPTLHKRFNPNTAILTGDALMVKAYQFLCQSPNAEHSIEEFSRAGIDLCEGQQLDMDYAELSHITDIQYFEMIGKKTAALMSAACAVGALSAFADDAGVDLMRTFGYNLGLAFQLQDDYLDAYGNGTFGKTIGGDIIECKKTCLFAYAYQYLHPSRKQPFLDIYNSSLLEPQAKIDEIMFFYDEAQVEQHTQDAINSCLEKSMQALQAIPASPDSRREMERFALVLVGREKQ